MRTEYTNGLDSFKIQLTLKMKKKKPLNYKPEIFWTYE